MMMTKQPAAPAVKPPEDGGQFHYIVLNEAGAIRQVNRVYRRRGYPDVLHDNGVSFLELPDVGGIDADTHHVEGAVLKRRPTIVAGLSKTRIKADGVDAVVIRPLPKPARITILRNGIVDPRNADLLINDTVFELTVGQPGRYRVEVDAFPHQRAAFEFEAVE